MPKIGIGEFLILIPSILQAIKTVEVELSDASGAEKKQAVMDFLEGGWSALPTLFGTEKVQNIPAFSVLAGLISAFIDLWVGIFNRLGLFKKKTPGG